MTDPCARHFPKPKIWRFERLITEHAFDKLRHIDCGFGEFAAALEGAEVIEEHVLDDDQLKELVLVVEWIRPLHVVVVVDDHHQEERIVPCTNRMPTDGTPTIVGGADAL